MSANLARVLAESGEKVVLIDADLRRPMIATQFGIDSKIGLTQVLAGRVALEDALQPTDTKRLKVLPAGRIPPNPSELVGSRQMADLIAKLEKDHMVIIDAPPILPVIDAGILTRQADGAILVVRVGKTSKDEVKLSAKRLQQVNGKLLGSVINMASAKNMGEVVYGYASKSYESHYSSQGDIEVEEIDPVVAPAGAMTGDRRSAQATQSGEAAQSERIEVAERDGINGEDRTDSGSASETDDEGLRTRFGPNQG